MFMEKPEHMKQSNPRDQLVAILSGLEGNLSNVQEGTTAQDQMMHKIAWLIEDLKVLGQWLPTEW
jgi:hypothetical protein